MIAKKYGFTARKVILIHSLSYYSKTHDKLQEFICKLHKKKPTKKRFLFCRRIRLFESSKSRKSFRQEMPGTAAEGGEKSTRSVPSRQGQTFCSDVQKVASGKFLCVGDRRNRENCERTWARRPCFKETGKLQSFFPTFCALQKVEKDRRRAVQKPRSGKRI